MEPIITKKCIRCGENKPVEEFSNSKSEKDGKQYSCKLCSKAYIISHRTKPAHSKRDRKNKFLKKTYGITMDDYDSLLLHQGGKCICGRKNIDRELSVDHNHKTGKVRGLLCFRCNNIIGLADDNPMVLEALLIYLEEQNPTDYSEL